MLSSVKTKERARAREMRQREGCSIKDIARRLQVSTSSVSLWVRDIELTPEQHEALMGENALYERQVKGRTVAAARRRAERNQAQARGRELARRAESLHVAGCMLYWAEGSKSRNQVQFSNSDPDMVRLFVTFLRTYFDVADESIRISCYLYADHVDHQREIEQFWLDTLALQRSSLCKSIVNVYSVASKRKRRNTLPYGTCRLTVSRTNILQSIYGSIQEYAGITRDEWLR